jgi:hypothetical protein
MLACVAALTAVALSAPSFAQDPSASPTPSAKPKQGTTAYCNTLKSASSKNACLKRLQASGNSAKAIKSTKAKAKKPAADPNAGAKPPNAAAAPASAPSQNVEVPPLPAKVI